MDVGHGDIRRIFAEIIRRDLRKSRISAVLRQIALIFSASAWQELLVRKAFRQIRSIRILGLGTRWGQVKGGKVGGEVEGRGNHGPGKLVKGAKVTGGKVLKGAPVARKIKVRGQKG
jgi:hypothetical protein